MNSPPEQQHSAAELRTIFDKYDLNKSNSLSYQEVTAMCKEAFGKDYPVEQIQEVFKEIDSNKDMTLSFEEFLAWWRVGRGASQSGMMIKNYLRMLDGVKTFDKGVDSINEKIGEEPK